MRVLVTGSSGFLGRLLCQELKRRGHAVKEFDSEKGQDICNPAQVREALKDMDAVVHAAGILEEGHPDLWKVNVQGTERVMEGAAESKTKRVVFLGTVGVYGADAVNATEETEARPLTGYEKSKWEAEKKAEEFHELLELTVLRLALVAGDNAYWRKMASYVRKGFPLIGSGKNDWQLLDARDAVSAILFCLENPRTVGETFLAAEEKASTLEEVFLEFRRAWGMDGKPVKVPAWLGLLASYPVSLVSGLLGKKALLSPDRVKRLQKNRSYSIAKIKALGWKPKYTMRDSVRELVKEMRKEEKRA